DNPALNIPPLTVPIPRELPLNDGWCKRTEVVAVSSLFRDYQSLIASDQAEHPSKFGKLVVSLTSALQFLSNFSSHQIVLEA
ncbi:1785_t:CDS:1, partial [Acaulospora colombiana]